jgi:hypothetical protein
MKSKEAIRTKVALVPRSPPAQAAKGSPTGIRTPQPLYRDFDLITEQFAPGLDRGHVGGSRPTNSAIHTVPAWRDWSRGWVKVSPRIPFVGLGPLMSGRGQVLESAT